MAPSMFSTSRGAPHPARSPQIEERLDARHIPYTFQPSFPVDGLRDAEGNQVRLGQHRAPKQMVDRYVEQMKNDAVFPGIVINAAGELVDGNTRVAAARRLGRKTIAAYVCSDLTPLAARALSVELNQSHGQSMTSQEIRAFVIGAVREGQTLDVRAYARMTGTKPATLRRWIKAEEARARAARAGLSVDSFELLPEPVQAALQQTRMQSVFVEAATLAGDARLNASTTKALVRDANAAASEAAAVVLIAREREARAADITTIASGFKPRRHRSASAAPHLAALMKYAASDFSDVPSDKVPDALTRMERLHTELGTALSQLRQVALVPAEVTRSHNGGAV
jgi:ParB-like chromosome segregation protein Spo0J